MATSDPGLLDLITAGPFGGIDPTSDPFELSPATFPDSLNFAPNLNFGGLQTVKGRQQLTTVATIIGSAGVCTGMTIFHRQNQPEVYIFAITANNKGFLVATDGNGNTLPLNNVPPSFTPNRQTFFAFAGQWCFMSNGADTPIKIDQNLNVTQWGISAPKTTPSVVQDAAAGNLLGKYWWACTFGNGSQESSQGVISTPVTISNQTWIATVTIGGTPTNGDLVTFEFNVGGNVNRTANITVSGTPTTAAVASQLAAAIIANFPTQFASAVASGNVITITTNIGINAASWWYIGFASGNATISPNAQTAFTGGTSGGKADLANIPQPSDPQVTEINLYRIGGSLGQWRLIATLAPGTTTYTDNLADASVTGQALTIFRDPPAKFTYICAHQGRIFGFADPSTVWFSNYNEPWGFNPSANTRPVGEGNFGDSGVAMVSLSSTLLLLKSRSCYSLIGSTDADFEVLPLYKIGCASPFSVAELEGTAFWCSNQSVWAYNGYSRENISDGAFQKSNIKAIFDSLRSTDRISSCGFTYDHGYYFSLPTIGKTFLYDLRTQSWWPIGFTASVATSDLEDSGHDPLVVGVDKNGVIAQWFVTGNDLEADLLAYVVTGIQDGGSLRSTKLYESLRLRAPIQSQGTQAQVTVYVNPDSPTQDYDVQTVMLDGSQGSGYAVQQQSLKAMKGYCAQARIDVRAQNQESIQIW